MDARAAMPDFAAIKQDFVTRFMTKKEAKVAKPKPVKVTKKPKAPKKEWKFDFQNKFIEDMKHKCAKKKEVEPSEQQTKTDANAFVHLVMLGLEPLIPKPSLMSLVILKLESLSHKT
ncbi:MAG: hypothetical protein O3C63_07810 [Cyanobacteria bacterium]|nr:hypothetical protein [Cyanobacteriota bacterium]MDA1021067.1 hypothetical protein [Cyanobacteriota bacterium]